MAARIINNYMARVFYLIGKGINQDNFKIWFYYFQWLKKVNGFFGLLVLVISGGALVTTRATSVVEGRKEGIIGRSITAQVGRGRCDQRSWLRIAIFLRCLRSLPSQLWVVAPSLFIDE